MKTMSKEQWIERFIELLSQEYTQSGTDEDRAEFYYRYTSGDFHRAVYECLMSAGEIETAQSHYPEYTAEDC